LWSPAAVASGCSPNDAALTRLELIESQPTSGGVLIATYRPAR
jgi:hypothetical protein